MIASGASPPSKASGSEPCEVSSVSETISDQLKPRLFLIPVTYDSERSEPPEQGER